MDLIWHLPFTNSFSQHNHPLPTLQISSSPSLSLALCIVIVGKISSFPWRLQMQFLACAWKNHPSFFSIRTVYVVGVCSMLVLFRLLTLLLGLVALPFPEWCLLTDHVHGRIYDWYWCLLPLWSLMPQCNRHPSSSWIIFYILLLLFFQQNLSVF